MALLTVYENDAAPTFVAASGGGDEFVNTGQLELLVYNASASDCDVTIEAQHPCSHGFTDDLVHTVIAGSLGRIRPFPAARFNNSNGRVSITYESAAGITVAVQKLA